MCHVSRYSNRRRSTGKLVKPHILCKVLYPFQKRRLYHLKLNSNFLLVLESGNDLGGVL